MESKNNAFRLQEGYWDCELAIKFNYPKDKLAKLLRRKLMFGYVSNRVDRISETLKQLEELVVPAKNVNRKYLTLLVDSHFVQSLTR